MRKASQFAPTPKRSRRLHKPSPPAQPGTYVLVLRARRANSIAIGRFGLRHIEPGCYLYVGSAFGPGGLRARLAHHLRRARHPRWHIDYLRAALALQEIWYAPGGVRRESLWARTVARLPGAGIPVSGFGASDHRGATHLYRFDRKPSVRRLARLLAQAVPRDAPILVQTVAGRRQRAPRRTGQRQPVEFPQFAVAPGLPSGARRPRRGAGA